MLGTDVKKVSEPALSYQYNSNHEL